MRKRLVIAQTHRDLAMVLGGSSAEGHLQRRISGALHVHTMAKAYGVPYAVASTSGTAAIHTALGALDLNPGDEVITAPITDLGTIIPILYQQCVPVFADIDGSYNMDPVDVEKKITDRTKAILVVHLFGNPCDMDAVAAIAKKHNIPLIEDCSQSHMTEYKGKYVGTIGDIGCFSFQQAKHMTTGDGGMTITSNKSYYDRMKLFVDKGYARKGWGSRAYLFLGMNYRMNELTAAVGLAQLKKVKGVVEKRYELGNYLTQLISDIPEVTSAPVTPGAKSSYWIYPFALKNGDLDGFAQKMKSRGIGVGAGYTGKPIYLCSESLTGKKTFGNSQFPFSSKVTDRVYEYQEGLCPVAEKALKHLICLPLNECWDKALLEKIAKAIRQCVGTVPSTTKMDVKVTRSVSAQPRVNENKKVRIAIIGCGQMGRWHLSAYSKNQNVELAAFVDTDLSKAEKFADEQKGNAYTNLKDLLKNEKIDGASVCTVPSTHRSLVLELLDAGINVLCEKPLSISVNDAREMLEKASVTNKLILPAFKFRFFEEIQNAKELLAKNSLGRIISFRLMFAGAMDMQGSWYADKNISGGGILMDNGPHAFDIIHYLFGDIHSTITQFNNFQKIAVEDTAQIICSLKNGTRGVIDLSWSAPIPSKAYLEIYGEDGTALLDLQGISYKFKTWDEFKRIPNKLTVKQAFALQIDHFVECILGQAPSIVHNEDGLKAQMAIESAYASVIKDQLCSNY